MPWRTEYAPERSIGGSGCLPRQYISHNMRHRAFIIQRKCNILLRCFGYNLFPVFFFFKMMNREYKHYVCCILYPVRILCSVQIVSTLIVVLYACILCVVCTINSVFNMVHSVYSVYDTFCAYIQWWYILWQSESVCIHYA